jgi:MOSC domain-containing protein YiiM
MTVIIIDPVMRNINGIVCALFVKPQKGAKSASRDSVRVTPSGFDGDHHAGVAKRRQILLVSKSLLEEFDLEPGDMYENAVLDGIDVMALKEGQQLRLGDAVVAVTIPCEPCIQMDRLRPGLKQQLKDRRGIFVKVLEPGTVRIGDPVCEVSAVENSHK